ICVGGTHAFIVEEDGKKYLALPGINPSAQFLGTIDADQYLDATLAEAWAIADRLHLAGVWIPAKPEIHSNRPQIKDAIAKKFAGRPIRVISRKRFSYNPAYFFNNVYEVTKKDIPQNLLSRHKTSMTKRRRTRPANVAPRDTANEFIAGKPM